jgi:hypothetical protein
MGLENMKVVGGTIRYTSLKSTLEEKIYEIGKAHVWLELLKSKNVPAKWMKPAKTGTRINIIFPQTQKEWDDSFTELKDYIVHLNKKYDMDMEIS